MFSWRLVLANREAVARRRAQIEAEHPPSPQDGANFATCVSNAYEGFPVGWGRVQGGAERGPRALVPGG